MALMSEQEGIDLLKATIGCGVEFSLAAAQRQLCWGYNRTYRMMLYAVESGQASRDETNARFTLIRDSVSNKEL